MPQHGEERNRHQWADHQEQEFQVISTGETFRVPFVGRSGTRSERWCATCEAWIAVGAGLNGGLIGFILCPTCGTEWGGHDRS